MALLFSSINDDADRWRNVFKRELPDLEFRVLSPEGADIGNPADIAYVLTWQPKIGAFKNLSNLEYIFSLGAGVDHLMNKKLPKKIPIVRLMDPELTRGMSEYILYWVLHHHRRMGDYEYSSRQVKWKQFPQANTTKRSIGIMGLGVLGVDAAQKLVSLGFKVSGWSRNQKKISGISTFNGKKGLPEFLGHTEMLICLLPLTPKTKGIINSETIRMLPRNSIIINVARGGHIIDNDLLQALDNGHISSAVLDVFHHEPLPHDHPFWKHPKISITPHIASLTIPETAALVVVENIRRIRKGQLPRPIVDPKLGY